MTREMHPDDEKAISLYQSLLAEHGETYRALDWGSRESQQKRFEVLAGIGISSGDRVLDVGCGLADFNAWLIEHRPGVEYSGIDLTPSMVERAQARFPNAKILNKTIFDEELPIGPFDFLFASGIFVFRQDSPEDYLFSTIKMMYGLCIKGISFNSLSIWAREKSPSEFYADPASVINFCKKLTHKVVLRHDYHPADFTIYMYK